MELGSYQGLASEMGKIAGISLSGLSPETIEAFGQPPEPIDTPGASKAKAVMARADEINAELMPKTAAVRRPNKEETASYLASALQGAGAGLLATKLIKEAPSITHNRTGAVLGAGLMLTHAAMKNSRRHAAKTAAALSPATRLKASQQVGSFANKIHAGPNPSKSIPKVHF